MNYLIILFIVLPIMLLGSYFYHKDTLKEPKKILQKLFLSGILSGIIVIIVSIIILTIFPTISKIQNTGFLKIFLYSFILVALIEELAKFFMIYKISYNHKDFDQTYDILLYSVFVGLGFACFENFLYVGFNDNSLFVALFRGITAIPAHACFQTFMGYYLSLSKYNGKLKKKYLKLSLIIPIVLHGTYDFLLLSGNIILVCIFLVFLVSMFIFTILKVKELVKIDEYNLKNSTK